MIETTIDISGLSKAEILAALFNAASPVGKGFIPASLTPGEMTVQEATEILKGGAYFDYLGGRSFKVDLRGDHFDPWLYDRDNGGAGTAEGIIERLRATGAVRSDDSSANRENMTTQHAYESPVNAGLGAAIADALTKWFEIEADGVPVPPEGMTPRQHLDWSSDQALVYFDKDEPDKAILLFLALVTMNPKTAWIATHPTTPMLLGVGRADGRSKLEYMMKGFAA